MCLVLNIHRSGYYAWNNNPSSKRALENASLLLEIKRSFADSHSTYGSPRVYRDVRASGLNCGENRVARLMREAELKSVHSYRRPRYQAGKPALASPNRLQQQFEVSRANVAWAMDITYIRTQEGWLYLAVVIDLYSVR